MNMLVPAVMFGWPMLAIALFLILQPRHAVLVTCIGAWLFLPIAEYPIPGLPDYTKVTAASLSVLAATVLVHPRLLQSFRPNWIDTPIILFCMWSATSSFTTGKGAWDALSAIIAQLIEWGLPYLIGRIYFTSLEGLRELVMGIVIGGIIYVPLCMIEIRLSPQLHVWFYGYHQHVFAQSIRFGGFRPTVFMTHGLAVAMWMVNATLLAIWMRLTGAVRRLGGIPMEVLIALMLVTCVLCKSTGALALLLVGLGTVAICLVRNRSWALILLIAVPPVWMLGRTFDWFSGQFVSDLFNGVSTERAESFALRLRQESDIIATALQHPICGGSRWFSFGADQWWLLCFRNFGAVGLAALSAVFLLPGLVICRRLTFTHMSDPRSSPIFGMILVITLYMIDNLANCMTNPIFTMIAGALGTTIVANDSLGPEIAVDQNEGKHKTLYVRRRLWPPPVTTSVREGAPPCIP